MQQLNVSVAFSDGWRLFKKHFITMSGLSMGIFFVVFLLILLAYGVTSVLLGFAPALVAIITGLAVLGLAAGGFCSVIKAYLNAYDGVDPSLRVVKETVPYCFHFILMWLLKIVIVVVPSLIIMAIFAGLGALMLNIDHSTYTVTASTGFGVLGYVLMMAYMFCAAVALQFAEFVFIENPSVGVIGALTESYKLVKKNILEVAVLYFSTQILNIIGMCIFFVGLIFTAMISSFAAVSAYKQCKAEGQAEETVVE